MRKWVVEKRFGREICISERDGAVCRMFGIDAGRLRDGCVTHRCEIEVGAGMVVYICGASGAGKSVLLQEFMGCVEDEDRVVLEDIELERGRSVIDCVGGTVLEGLRILSRCGLGDCFCMLSEPVRLSEGQKWRYRLAKAMDSGRRFVFADEFCSGLDAVTAAVTAYNVRRYADERGVTFVLAGHREDVLGDLRPDVLVVKGAAGEAEVEILNPNS